MIAIPLILLALLFALGSIWPLLVTDEMRHVIHLEK